MRLVESVVLLPLLLLPPVLGVLAGVVCARDAASLVIFMSLIAFALMGT